MFAIFAQKFRDSYGIEYPAQFSPADAKIAVQISSKIKALGVTVDDYLNWIFDEYSSDNDKLRITQFKTLVSDFFINTFAIHVHDTGLDKLRADEQKRNAEGKEIRKPKHESASIPLREAATRPKRERRKKTE